MEKSSASTVRRQPKTASPAKPPAQQEPLLGDDHPLNDIIGTHEGEEWEAILENIKRNRKELDRLVLGEEGEK